MPVKVAPNRPRLTYAEAVKILLSRGIDPAKAPALLGIRGYFLDTMGVAGANDRNIYDDCMAVVWEGHIHTFNANTDPSVKRKGVAIIEPGVYPFKLGNHGISRPGGGYPALRPATPGELIPCRRDGQTGILKAQATNIHKGGYNSTSSLGCQTLYPSQWSEFIGLVTSLMKVRKMPTIQYCLITEEDRRRL